MSSFKDFLKSKVFFTFLIFFIVLTLMRVGWNIIYTFNSSIIEQNKVAIIYARVTFHEEVNSVLACMLKSLGYFVVMYIGNGVHISNIMIPFTGLREAKSKKFYGKCVDNWVTIYDNMPISPSNPSLVIFTTFPMVFNGHKDHLAYHFLKYISKNNEKSNQKTPVIFVSHTASELQEKSKLVENLYSSIPITYLFLGEHTYLTGIKEKEMVKKSFIANKEIKDNFEGYPFYLEYIIPTMPLSELIDISNKPFRNSGALFSMQGNFGGKHAKRKNISSVVSCMKSIDDDFSKFEHRYDLDKLKLFHFAQNKTSLSILKPRLDLDLVGHLMGPVHLETFQHGEIKLKNDLDHPHFYKEISQSKFIVSAIGDNGYFNSKATSTIPTALMTGVPIISTRDFLMIYPCLRDLKIHNKVNKLNQCDSLFAATQVDSETYQDMKNEVSHCSNLLWKQSRKTINKIINQNNKIFSLN